MKDLRLLADYPAIKKLASALHRLEENKKGAAILVGAGFSRSAARHVDGRSRMPLWSEVTKSLAQQIYNNNEELTFADPLRIAEEYRAYFGQAALNDRIRFEIKNDAWQSGPLYDQLLKLPWTDVLTTNWDTLLEKGAEKIHSPYYTVVTKVSDLAWAQAPRIVKLHGSIGITEKFIAALEDYRTYPNRYAPFVNFTRQIFIENELCLLGFSGDDPNFLQWAGWVRDHLADHSRKIYLVGALNLSAARRKQLESINIAPVDLWPAVAEIDDPDVRHEEATRLFLCALKEQDDQSRPHEWRPKNLNDVLEKADDHHRAIKDPDYAAELLSKKLDALRLDRESYPGWLVCPPMLRRKLSYQLITPSPNEKNVAALNVDDRGKLLYEIAWRHSITFDYISPWLSNALCDLAISDADCSIDKRQKLEIALIILHNSRWIEMWENESRDEIEAFRDKIIKFIQNNAGYLNDEGAEISYFYALVARDRLDYDGIAAEVDKVVGEDLIWKSRRSALLIEIGRVEEAVNILDMAYSELRESHRRDRQSIPIISRMLWVHWMLSSAQRGAFNKNVDEIPAFVESNYRKWECDPWEWLRYLQHDIDDLRRKSLEEQVEIEPLFKQGYYRDHSESFSGNTLISRALLFDGVSRAIGIPLYINFGGVSVSVLSEDASKLVLSGKEDVGFWSLGLAIRSSSSESAVVIRRVFSRIGVARLNQEVVDVLVDRLLDAINYWFKERAKEIDKNGTGSLSKLRVFMEVLGRLAVRVSPSRADEIFRLAISWGQNKDLLHLWLFESLGNLLDHSLKSIPEGQQGEVLEAALEFPFKKEVANNGFDRWPNPVVAFPHDRDAYSDKLAISISRTIEAVKSYKGAERADPLLRLLPLASKPGFLTSTERDSLGCAIWGDPHDYSFLPDTGLFPHALLMFPVKNSDRAKGFVKSYLYSGVRDALEDTNKDMRVYPSPEVDKAVSIFESMANAAENKNIGIFPDRKEAVGLFRTLVDWRPRELTSNPSRFGKSFQGRLTISVCHALSYAIVPSLDPSKLNYYRFKSLECFYKEVEDAYPIIPAFVYFANASARCRRSVERIIKKSLMSGSSLPIGYSAIALNKWASLPGVYGVEEFDRLIDEVINIIRFGHSPGLQQLLFLVKELFDKELLRSEHVKVLLEVLPFIYGNSSYDAIDPNGAEAVSASSIREGCVKLLSSITERFSANEEVKELLAVSKQDPLPEVRFAAK